jgi:6-methylsalicylate decarboxylase
MSFFIVAGRDGMTLPADRPRLVPSIPSVVVSRCEVVPRIDAHVHLVPAAYRAEVERVAELDYLLPQWSPESTLDFMDKHQIDAAVMSISPPGVYFGDGGLARELSRMCNEETAALVRSDPGRFAGLAVLPLPDVDNALREVDHALDVLGLDGVMLFSNVGGIYPGDDVFEPVLRELDRRGAYVFLHPQQPATPWPTPAMPVWLQELPFDTTRAVVQLIYTGAFEQFPRIRWQLAHLGGTVPFLAARIASLADRQPDAATLAPRGARAYLGRLFCDTGLMADRIAFEASRGVFGSERIVFGSDWPYLALPRGSDPAPGLDYLDADERAALDGRNIAALVPRLFPRATR